MRFFPSKILWSLCAALFFAAMWLGSASCKKDKLLDSGGELRFSTDTVAFDTVFTTLGSATVGLKIFNPQDQKVSLSSVRIDGGATSFFHINVDGRQGPAVSDVEIAANDSVYVFATVKVDPTAANTPFIIEDRLTATLNGKDFSIPMIAYGQNAHFIKDSVLAGNQTWLTDKPYVIFGYCIVDSAQSLTIPAGCRIFMHANARLFVDGTLTAIGTKKDSIIFQGDRLDRSYFGYEGYPGEWGGLYFTQNSRGNTLEHVILRNGGNSAQGTVPALMQLVPGAQVNLKKVIIENSSGYGLLSFGGTVAAQNCLFHSCGASALALVQGGNYQLDYCTIATYGNNKIAHNDNPVAIILNFYDASPTQRFVGALNATLRNCVVAGSLGDEFIADSTKEATAALMLQNCFLKADGAKTRPWVTQQSVKYLNTGTTGYDSLFKSIVKNDYHPGTSSPLIDAALSLPGISDDLEDGMRGAKPDIGAYERKQ